VASSRQLELTRKTSAQSISHANTQMIDTWQILRCLYIKLLITITIVVVTYSMRDKLITFPLLQ